jgi:hypothetical protein
MTLKSAFSRKRTQIFANGLMTWHHWWAHLDGGPAENLKSPIICDYLRKFAA